jgi:hypothetical protein
MFRCIRIFLKTSDILHIMYKPVVLLVFFALEIGGCSTDEESNPNASGNGGSVGTVGESAATAGESAATANAGGSAGGTAGSSISGVDPANPCSDPTILTRADLASLAGCTSIKGDLDVPKKATEITDLSGLNLVTVEGNLKIEAPNLKSIQGLSKLTSVGGTLTIGAASLTTLDGLNNLVSVGGDLFFFNCATLTDLNGLRSLATVTGLLSITNSPGKTSVLASLGGLGGLTKVGKLKIERNNNLPTCEAQALREKLGLPKDDPIVSICENRQDDCSEPTKLKCTVST